MPPNNAKGKAGGESPILAQPYAEFLIPGVSVIVASRDDRHVPSVSRGLAVLVSDDRRQVRLVLRRSQAARLLDDICRSAVVAACFSQPSTHHTLQLKGRDAWCLAATEQDEALAAEFREGFWRQLQDFGYPEGMVRAMLSWRVEDLVAVQFTPSEVYGQTPGPRAGERLA